MGKATKLSSHKMKEGVALRKKTQDQMGKALRFQVKRA